MSHRGKSTDRRLSDPRRCASAGAELVEEVNAARRPRGGSPGVCPRTRVAARTIPGARYPGQLPLSRRQRRALSAPSAPGAVPPTRPDLPPPAPSPSAKPADAARRPRRHHPGCTVSPHSVPLAAAAAHVRPSATSRLRPPTSNMVRCADGCRGTAVRDDERTFSFSTAEPTLDPTRYQRGDRGRGHRYCGVRYDWSSAVMGLGR